MEVADGCSQAHRTGSFRITATTATATTTAEGDGLTGDVALGLEGSMGLEG